MTFLSDTPALTTYLSLGVNLILIVLLLTQRQYFQALKYEYNQLSYISVRLLTLAYGAVTTLKPQAGFHELRRFSEQLEMETQDRLIARINLIAERDGLSYEEAKAKSLNLTIESILSDNL
jgi:hypothetical protein